MNFKHLLIALFFVSVSFSLRAQDILDKNSFLEHLPDTVDLPDMSVSLDKIMELLKQNRSIIIGNIEKQIAAEKLTQAKVQRAPELNFKGDGFWNNNIPLADGYPTDNSFLYHFNLSTEIDLYAGGKHHYAIEHGKKIQELSAENLRLVEQDVQLEAFVMLYDIYRNIEYRRFMNSYINLREKEYDRINQLYRNGIVLKSDLLRSKLYITDLQKDVVEITNSIDILSDKLCVMLGLDQRFDVIPNLEGSLEYKIQENFQELFTYACENSPRLKMYQMNVEEEEIILKEIRSENLPHLSLYALYGVGSPMQLVDYDHRVGGEVGARLTLSIDSFYKNHHLKKAQRSKIEKENIEAEKEREDMRNRIYRLYTRYHESLLNITRALEKIEMSNESTRILTNSYFNQQALLIDVLESETKSMEAAFEYVEAVVDSQKYYWALKSICGYL